MSEREMQSPNDEAAICHVCDAHFESQLELSQHLKDAHPDDLLGDPTGH